LEAHAGTKKTFFAYLRGKEASNININAIKIDGRFEKTLAQNLAMIEYLRWEKAITGKDKVQKKAA